MAAPARRAYRRHDVVRLYGVPLRTLDRMLAAGEIRHKRVGRAVYIDPEEVERVFGFESDSDALQPSAESVSELRGLLA